VTDRAALIDAITAGTAQLGPIAVLIFNPTGFTPEPAARVNIEALRRDLNVAVLGAVTAVQTALPSLADTVPSGSPTTLLITGGGVARDPRVEARTLPITKAAERPLIFAVADELTAGCRRRGFGR